MDQIQNTAYLDSLELPKRECGMMVNVAAQGIGKTNRNKKLICEYVKDKIETKIRGRKCLVLDTNGEYGTETFGIDGIPPLQVKRIAVKDVYDWCRNGVAECRRIDMKSLSIDQKLAILKYISQIARNIMLVLEDINTIILDVTHEKNIISNIVNLRHKGVDVIISYQSLRAVEPRVLGNCRYVRLYYINDDTDETQGKLGDKSIFKIAQLIIMPRYYAAMNDYQRKKISENEWKERKSFNVFVYRNPYKLVGDFTKEEFMMAAKKYLAINKKRWKDEMEMSGCTQEAAVNNQAQIFYNDFYGNSDKQFQL